MFSIQMGGSKRPAGNAKRSANTLTDVGNLLKRHRRCCSRCGEPVEAECVCVWFFMWNKVSHRILFDLSENGALKIPSD